MPILKKKKDFNLSSNLTLRNSKDKQKINTNQEE
jgi:hypothetical protein